MDGPPKNPELKPTKRYKIVSHGFTRGEPGALFATGTYEKKGPFEGVLIFTNVTYANKSKNQPKPGDEIRFETNTYHFELVAGGKRSRRRTGKKHGRRHKKTRKH